MHSEGLSPQPKSRESGNKLKPLRLLAVYEGFGQREVLQAENLGIIPGFSPIVTQWGLWNEPDYGMPSISAKMQRF
jgi:hypothetical protein